MRVLSGMRPTGQLHLGNYHGALERWVELQKTHECFYFVADWHALTTDYASTENLRENAYEMAADWLAAGLSPERSTLFVQSRVPEHAELHLLLSMVTPVSWLERCPTYKEQLRELKDKDVRNFGFLGYPVLQTADILLYKAKGVPVGEDQLAHLELSREICRRFNGLYGEIFPEPEALLTPTPKVVGTDGRKMSKSYGNCIYLSDAPSEIGKKVSQMITDPQKIKKNDKGNPDICSVFWLQKIYQKDASSIESHCRTGKLGCVECKGTLSESLAAKLSPIRERREAFSKSVIEKSLDEGSRRAQSEAKKTLAEVKSAMHLV